MQGVAVLPVSRRRWSQVSDILLMHQSLENSEFTRLINSQGGNKLPVRGQAERPIEQMKHLIGSPIRQVCAVIKDDVKSLLLQQILEEKWPQCTVRFFANGASLTEHIARTASHELPSLVLLDIRSVGRVGLGLGTLEYIKSDKRLRIIPTVVFISGQTGNDIEMCYAAGANSVVSQLEDYETFTEVVERICQYWLSFAALPMTAA